MEDFLKKLEDKEYIEKNKDALMRAIALIEKEKKEKEPEIEKINKLTLCVLMTQVGKTFTAIQRIEKSIEDDWDYGRSIHIIFTMNTLLNNQQFSKRLERIEETYGENSVCILSSKYKGDYQHVKNQKELQGLFLDESKTPRVVLMCSNKPRFKNGLEFIQLLERNQSIVSRVYVYYDEIHEYLKFAGLREQIEEIHNCTIVKDIFMMTATPDPVFTRDGFWSQIPLIHYENYQDTNYVGYHDINFVTVNDFYEKTYKRPHPFDFESLDEETLGNIEHILNRYPNILDDGKRSFIPVHIRRSGHYQLIENIFERKRNAVIILLNSVEKSLTFYSDKGIKSQYSLESKDEEVSVTLTRIIKKYKLEKRPMIVTGFLCVGMGQTLTNQELGPFHYAIFGHMDQTNEQIYQLFGRITGRMKDWKTYVKTTLYCPETIKNRCRIMEECSRRMVTDFNGETMTGEIYREPMEGPGGSDVLGNIRKKKEKKKKEKMEDLDKDYRLFKTQEEGIKFGMDVLDIKFNKRKNDHAPEELRKKTNNNPTFEYLLERMWGINQKNKARMIPTDKGEWCVYWRPSLIENE